MRVVEKMASIYDSDYFITPLSPFSYTFPDPNLGAKEGLLAYGGDLNPNRLLTAYRNGIFPWFNENDPILWWSPDPRLVLYPQDFKVRRSFRRVLRNRNYRVCFDNDFRSVISSCASMPKRQESGTWLSPKMQEAYIELHNMGFAHSVEVYENDELIGGLYGVSLGRAFFGESMFSKAKDASKIALKALSDVLRLKGYDFIDCQVVSEHLQSLGARVVTRRVFLQELESALNSAGDIGSWIDYKWEYRDD